MGELDRRGGWEESGSGSVAEWLAWRCALLPRAAREHVRVARRLPDLPLTHEAFACGELSYAKVRALTRVAEPHSEERLLGLARVMTAAQLERALAALRRVTTAVARELHEKAELTTFWDDDGSLVIHGRLAPEDGALLLRALQHARDGLMERVLKEERGSAEPRPRPTNAEALVAVADTALASNPRHSGADRYQVVVHVDANVLEQDGEGGSALDDGPAVSPETARRICCDSSVVAISHRNGRTVRAGRKTRAIQPALRRALEARDRGCRFPGCQNRRFVDAHHIRHWAHGGETALDNLVLLCGRHHIFVHEGGFTIDDDGNFYNPYGLRLPEVWRAPPGDVDDLRRSHAGLDIGPKTCASGDNDPMDLDLAVDVLLDVTGFR